MLLTNKARKTLLNYPYLETVAIVGIYLGAGYFTNPQDICMLESSVSFLTIVLTIITLFHGISSGLLAISLFGVAMKFGYPDFFYEVFLSELVLVLIFGEFHYYWTQTIILQKTEAEFTRHKLFELSKAFYTLKISHDQIEKSYVVKPMSIQNSIRKIKDDFYARSRDDFFQQFLQLLKKVFTIEKAYLLEVEDNGNIVLVAASDEESEFDTKDLMVVDVFEKKMPIYVSGDEEYSAGKYLAVIPAVSDDTVVGIFAIEKIPFMSFNKDALISISILVNYMFDELHKMRILNGIRDFMPYFQENFRFEIYRLNRLYKKHSARSTVLIFRSKSKLKTHLILSVVEKNLRALDIMSSTSTDKADVIAILFPFSDVSSVHGYMEKVKQDVEIKDSNLVEIASFPVSKIDLIESFVLGQE